MKARFTTISNQEVPRSLRLKNVAQSTSLEKSLWAFLKSVTTCIEWVLPNRKTISKKQLAYSRPIRRISLQSNSNAIFVNSIGIDQHYHLPGASPPTHNFEGIDAHAFYSKCTSLQFNKLQTMSQLSISPPRKKQRILGARFDEYSKRWVSTSPPLEEKEVNSYDSVAYTDSGFPENRFTKPFKLWMGTFTLVLFTAFAALAQTKVVDIRLSKKVDIAQPTLGQTIKFTVYAKNEGQSTATGIVVKDAFPIGGATLTGNTPAVGTTFNTGTGLWTIPSISAGDSVKLELTGTVIGRGVYFNIAEVMSMAAGQEDYDSDPGNGVLGEDDYATACFSVPILWYPGDEYTVALSVPGYSDVSWTKVGKGAITGVPSDSAKVSGDTLIITGTGRFAFTAFVKSKYVPCYRMLRDYCNS
ncbi:MAG: DUF11 domain-containing protein [Spirosomataceae bacterium]